MSGTKRRADTMTVYLTDHDLALLDELVDDLRAQGRPVANRADALHEAMECLTDLLRGMSSREVMQFFLEHQRLRSLSDDGRPRKLKQVVH